MKFLHEMMARKRSAPQVGPLGVAEDVHRDGVASPIDAEPACDPAAGPLEGMADTGHCIADGPDAGDSDGEGRSSIGPNGSSTDRIADDDETEPRPAQHDAPHRGGGFRTDPEDILQRAARRLKGAGPDDEWMDRDDGDAWSRTEPAPRYARADHGGHTRDDRDRGAATADHSYPWAGAERDAEHTMPDDRRADPPSATPERRDESERPRESNAATTRGGQSPAADTRPLDPPAPVTEEAAMRLSRQRDGDRDPPVETVPVQRKIWDLPDDEDGMPRGAASSRIAARTVPDTRPIGDQPRPQAAPVRDIGEPAPRPDPVRPRGGRVKTRLLGFNRTEDGGSRDPFATDAPAVRAVGEPTFPVGWMIVVDGPGRGASFELQSGASKIGRGEDQAIRLDFGDTAISRDNHAAVAFDEETRRFFVGHGGKANLVRLNDVPVLATEPLADGDLLRIGETSLRFIALCGPDFTWREDQIGGHHAAAE